MTFHFVRGILTLHNQSVVSKVIFCFIIILQVVSVSVFVGLVVACNIGQPEVIRGFCGASFYELKVHEYVKCTDTNRFQKRITPEKYFFECKIVKAE